jgi:hypothetical protein
MRRPPTNAKLVRLLADLGAWNEANEVDIHVHVAASDAIRKIYRNGLPSGLDPAVVTAAIAAVMPLCYELTYLTKKVGTEYDEAIVAGVRARLARAGIDHVLEPALVATLTERAGMPIATANQALLRAEREVGRDPDTNLPASRSPAVLERASAAMDAWFAPAVAGHTLALARMGMPPTAWASGDGATSPQTDDEWALLIGCALHPSEESASLLAERIALIPLLDEPGRAAVCDVLRYAHRKHGARVPMPPAQIRA